MADSSALSRVRACTHIGTHTSTHTAEGASSVVSPQQDSFGLGFLSSSPSTPPVLVLKDAFLEEASKLVEESP